MDTEALETKMSEENKENLEIGDISLKDLKESIIQTNEDLLDSLRERFMQNLLSSMVFFIFNEICQHKSDSSVTDDSPAKKFFAYWLDSAQKQSKKEILGVNKKLKDEKMTYLSAISDFSLPTTEDYQLIYNQALLDVKKIFEKNTKLY